MIFPWHNIGWGLAGQSSSGVKGVWDEIFFKNSANRSIMSPLSVAIVCLGGGGGGGGVGGCGVVLKSSKY